MEHSSSYDARFHASLTLREAVVRDWSSLQPPDVRALRTYLLHYLLQSCADPVATLVRSQLVAVLALMLKRGWLQYREEQAGFLQVRV